MTLDLKTLTDPADVDRAFQIFLRAMVGLPFRDTDATALTEPGRYLGAFDDGALVAGADSYTSWLTVPGGARVPHAAVTHVGVLPTHRRRGIVSGLITHQLRDAAARGEVLASLRASEAVIYERFGYGVATSSQSARVALGRAALRPGLPEGGAVRLLEAHELDDVARRVYEGAAWTGSIARPDGWWELHRRFRDRSPAVTYGVAHSTDGIDDGYALYRPEGTDTWFTSPERVVTVTDLVAHTPQARAGLWRHLLTLDLVDVVVVDDLPLDDPLPLALTDRRAVTLGSPHDETWLRLVDVEKALAARTYGTSDPVVIGVTDALLRENAGAYDVGPKGVTRTSAPPDLTIDVATLATVYLGGTTWRRLHDVGRVEERQPGAVVRADELFATTTAPFAGTGF